MTEQRLAEAQAAIEEIIGEQGCLMRVLDGRMEARGFSPEEARAGLDAIAKRRMVHIRKFTHPVLGGELFVSFRRGHS